VKIGVDAAGPQPPGDQVPRDLVLNRGVDAHGRSIITPWLTLDVLDRRRGPIGLTAAIELPAGASAAASSTRCTEPPQYAKAVGVQPRTLEVFEGMGVLRRILDAASLMRGQIVYVNGEAGRNSI
jgi:hypothetical protein